MREGPTFTPAFYKSPISIPEATSGKFAITHRTFEAGSAVALVGMRQAFLRGLRPVSVRLTEPLLVHSLSEDGSVWMTDLPEELNQIMAAVQEAMPHGTVLVGGLGLGILSTVVVNIPGVEEVVTVEREPDVIKLVTRMGKPWSTVQSDIGTFLETSERFDCYLLDTWAGTSESTWWEEVMPLRRTIRRRFGRKPRIHCWAEDIMAGQLVGALGYGKDSWYYKGLPAMTEREAMRFIVEVGLPSWEHKYGGILDATIREMQEGRRRRAVGEE